MADVEFRSSDGVPLSGTLREVPGDGSRCVVLAHGLTVTREEDGVFTRLAEGLAGAGLPSFRFDFRCHGRSGAAPEGLTVAGEARDLEAALVLLGGRGYWRFGLVAASFSGGAASIVAPRHPGIAAVVLWNSVVDYGLSSRLKEAAKSGGLEIGGRKFPLGPAILGEIQALRPADALARLAVPVLLVHGDRDGMVSPKGSVDLARRIPGAELALIPGAGHGFHDETSCAAACAAAAGFLARHLA